MSNNNTHNNVENGEQTAEVVDEVEDDDVKDHPLLDDDIVSELENTPHEDPLLTNYMGDNSDQSTSDDAVSEVSQWLPNGDENKDQTIIHPNQVHALAVLRNYNEFYPEFEKENQAMQKILDDFEKYLVSVNGIGREQQVEVLSSLFASHKVDDDRDDDESEEIIKTF